MAGKKILLDAPTDQPTLRYANIARTFAGIITDSRPRFAIGIFGGWGSGKTTLMGAIRSELTGRGIVTVDFNAWRFEREPQLLVPLLDAIRAAVIEYAQRDPNTAKKVRAFAERLGKVVRVLVPAGGVMVAGRGVDVRVIRHLRLPVPRDSPAIHLPLPGDYPFDLCSSNQI